VLILHHLDGLHTEHSRASCCLRGGQCQDLYILWAGLGPARVPCMGLSHVSSIRPVGLTTLCMGSEPVNKGIEYQNPKLLPYLLLLLPPVRRRRLRQPHYPAGSSRCCSPASPACPRSTQGRHKGTTAIRNCKCGDNNFTNITFGFDLEHQTFTISQPETW
jgi:hypothetical protein